ncbi:MAG: polysaccharide biosynthesis/export family protein [Sedimentitalea sp.]|uniref:polysaccharide biosynthesis/export family protein n=2 Tax=Sedimentitalea sp. TaxID=2048915 RepID=UPI0032648F83
MRLSIEPLSVLRAVALTASFWLVSSSVLMAQTVSDYALSRNDVLRIDVVDRLAQVDVLPPLEKVSGTYQIDSSGRVNIAFVGPITAQGLAVGELSEQLAKELGRAFGLIELPGVAVSVEQYAPVYVAGQVELSGAYTLPPGALALQALALAGGLKSADEQTYAVERDLFEGKFNNLMLEEGILRLEARSARLEAEQSGADVVTYPGSLSQGAHPNAAKIIQLENQAFDLARQRYLEDLAALDELEDLLRTELASNERKLTTQKERLGVVAAAADDLDQLAERGLVRTDRLLAIQSTQASIEVTVIDLEQSIYQGRARLAEIERERRFATTDRGERALLELVQVREELAIAQTTLEMENALSRVSVNHLGAARADAINATEPSFRILREGPNGLETIEATGQTQLRPNDFLEVLINQARE